MWMERNIQPCGHVIAIHDKYLEYLLSPILIDAPPSAHLQGRQIGCYFDQLSETEQCHILNSVLFHYDNIHPDIRLRFFQLIQPRHSSVRELVQWMLYRCTWEPSNGSSSSMRRDELPTMVSQDCWNLLSSCWVYNPIDGEASKDELLSGYQGTTTEEASPPQDKWSNNNKRKRKDDPWHSIIKSMKTSSLSADKVVGVLKNTSLEQWIAGWQDYWYRYSLDAGCFEKQVANCTSLLCMIGNEILQSYVDESNPYSVAHLIAVISYLFVPFVVRLRYGASRQVLCLWIEWAKKWPLLMQRYFILPLCQYHTLEAPQVEVIGKVTQHSFSSYLVQDTMRRWWRQDSNNNNRIQPWNESILVLFEQWLFLQVTDGEIISLFIRKSEANAPFVELSPKWIKLLYDLCQQYLSICIEHQHILRRCLVTTSSYLTEKCLVLLTNRKPLK